MKFSIQISVDFPEEQELAALKPEAKAFLYERSLQDALDSSVKKLDISQTKGNKTVPSSYKISVKAEK